MLAKTQTAHSSSCALPKPNGKLTLQYCFLTEVCSYTAGIIRHLRNGFKKVFRIWH